MAEKEKKKDKNGLIRRIIRKILGTSGQGVAAAKDAIDKRRAAEAAALDATSGKTKKKNKK